MNDSRDGVDLESRDWNILWKLSGKQKIVAIRCILISIPVRGRSLIYYRHRYKTLHSAGKANSVVIK